MDKDKIINLKYSTINEPLPEFIYKGLKNYCTNSNIYHPQPPELRKKLSEKLNIPQDLIFLTVGADEAIQLFAKRFGEKAFVFTPTYSVYADVEVFGGKLTRLTSLVDNKYEVNTKTISNASLIFLANPNNPVGFTSKERTMALVKNNPQAIVVIDEAYGDFCDLSVINEVKKYSNMAVIRSFSKSYGMAGARLGFIAANRKIIDQIKNLSTWANVSFLSVGAAMTALDNEKYFNKIRKEINFRRTNFQNFLRRKNFLVLDSQINTVLIKFDSQKPAKNFVDLLNKNRIYVNHGNADSNIGLDLSYVRITVGTESQMNKVEKVLRGSITG